MHTLAANPTEAGVMLKCVPSPASLGHFSIDPLWSPLAARASAVVAEINYSSHSPPQMRRISHCRRLIFVVFATGVVQSQHAYATVVVNKTTNALKVFRNGGTPVATYRATTGVRKCILRVCSG